MSRWAKIESHGVFWPLATYWIVVVLVDMSEDERVVNDWDLPCPPRGQGQNRTSGSRVSALAAKYH